MREKIMVVLCFLFLRVLWSNSTEGRTIINEKFQSSLLDRGTWQVTDEGVSIKDGKCLISEGGQILSVNSYPEGVLEIRLSLTKPLTSGAVAWGFRHKYGARPRITFSVEESMELRASIYDNEGKKMIDSQKIPLDCKVHNYKIVWQPKRVVFYFDGKEIFNYDFEEDIEISPRPITIYNVGSDTVVSVEEITYRTDATDEQLAEIKNKYQFRLGSIKDLKFVELIHVDMTELPEVSDFWKERGYIIFSRPYTQRVFCDDTPEAGEIIDVNKGLTTFVTPDEYEPITFAVHALKETKEYEVSITDLSDGKGHFIFADAISIGMVRSLNKRLLYNYKWSPDYIFMPTFIEGKKRANIPSGKNAQYWLTIKVPKDTKAGKYFGMIEFASIYGPEGGIPTRFPLTIEVLPFTLKEADRYTYGFWYPASNYINTREEFASDFLEMRKHNMNALFGGVGIGATAEEKDGKIVIKGVSDKFNWICEEYKKADFKKPILYSGDIGSSWANSRVADIQSEQWQEEYIRYTRAVLSMVKKNYGLDLIVQPIDEPAWQGEAIKDKCVRYLRLLKKAGAVTETDGPYDTFMVEEAGPYSDVWNINGGLCPIEKIKQHKAEGKILWAYNNDVEGIRPELMRYAAGYWLWISGADGINNWAYRTRSGKSIYNDLSGETSNFVYYYPKTDNEIGGPAIAFEGFREGIDDIRYLLTWEDAVEKAKKEGKTKLAGESQAKITEVFSKINWNYRLRDQAKWQRTFYLSTGQKAVVGDLKVTNGLSWEDYDKIRKVIADEIVKLISEK